MILKGKNSEIDVPLYVNEITLPEFTLFKRARQKWIRVLLKKSFIDEDFDDLSQALLEVLGTVVKGDLTTLPFYQKVEGFEFISIDYKGPLSLYQIYQHVLYVINSYEPIASLSYSFEWFDEHGEPKTYFIEPDRTKRLYASKSYTIGEAIELKEFERKADKKIKSNAKKEGADTNELEKIITSSKRSDEEKSIALAELEIAGDAKGNIAFSLSTREMAILARPEGEKLPIKKSDRQRLINERVRLFNEITLDIYFNVRFFLLGILRDYLQSLTTGGFSSQPRNHFTVVSNKGSSMRKVKK